jgi:hypothetical protein
VPQAPPDFETSRARRRSAHRRGFGQLAQETARGLEGAVDVPQGAGAAVAGELQPRGGVALGDGAGLVDAAKKNGTPLAPGRCRVERRWATCSIEAPNWIERLFEVVAGVAGGLGKRV